MWGIQKRNERMTTTGELLSIIEKLGLVDIGEATSYLDEDEQANTIANRETYEKGYVETLAPGPFYEQEAKTA